MSDLVERLRERATSYRAGGPSSEHTAVMLEKAATRIEKLEAENASLATWQCEFTDGKTGLVYGQGGTTFCIMAKRMQQLEAEVKVWQGHAKTAIWSDSEECKVLEAEVERLLNSRNRWAKKYNDLLEKRRAEDGYDVYAAAREEYRKKIIEQASRIEQLEAALREIGNPPDHFTINDATATARAALGEERT